MAKTKWVYTAKRKQSMRKAQIEHSHLVALGKRAKARGMR